jgi:hypothetical protein
MELYLPTPISHPFLGNAATQCTSDKNRFAGIKKLANFSKITFFIFKIREIFCKLTLGNSEFAEHEIWSLRLSDKLGTHDKYAMYNIINQLFLLKCRPKIMFLENEFFCQNFGIYENFESTFWIQFPLFLVRTCLPDIHDIFPKLLYVLLKSCLVSHKDSY